MGPSTVLSAAARRAPVRSEASVLDELLSRIGHRDSDAFVEFHNRMTDRLCAVIRRQLVDLDQTHEVLQEVWLEIWLTADRFEDSRGHAGSWVTVMAKRRAIDRIRASEAARRRDLRIGLRDVPVAVDDVGETVMLRVEYARVMAVSGCLTDRQREAMDLVYGRGLSYAEAADVAGVRQPTLKTRLRDGLLRLRAELEAS